MLSTKGRTILVAVDKNDLCQKAFEWYWSNVHLENDRIIILHVSEYETFVQPQFKTEAGFTEAFKNEENETYVFLEEMEELLRDKQLMGEVRSFNGDPGKTIVNVAIKENVDLIVMGARGMGVERCEELGTVAVYVTNHTPAPVIICKG